MADVRCPMCGKPNPADAVSCRYCQARLKPLNSPADSRQTPPATPPATPSEDSKGDTDWLRGLLGSSSAPDESSPAEPGPAAEDSADWLSRIRQRTQEEQDELSKIGSKPSIDENAADSDWMADLAASDSSPAAGGSDVSAWLASLRDNEEPQPPAKQPAAPSSNQPPPAAKPAPPPQAKEDDEWLRSLTARIQASQSLEDQVRQKGDQPPAAPIPSAQTAQPESSTEDLPDWLRELDVTQPPETQAGAPVMPQTPEADAEPSAEVPDWLKDLQPKVEPAVEPVPPTSPEDVPAWLRDFQSPVVEEASPSLPDTPPAANFPSWMNDLGLDQPTGPSAEAASEPAASNQSLPEWMRDFQSEPAAAETPPANLGEPAAPAEDMPAWLREMQAETRSPSAAPAAPIEPPAAPAKNLPAWLRDQPSAALPPETPVTVSPADQAAPADETLPDWLSDFDTPADSLPAASSPAVPLESATENADWLSEFGAVAETPAPEPLSAEETPDWLRDFNQTAPAAEPPAEAESAAQPAQIPDWLRDFQGMPATQAAGLTPPANLEAPVASGPLAEQTQPAASDDGTPDWLKDFETTPAESSMPAHDWLTSLDETPAAPPAGATAALEGFSEDQALPATDIPAWLKSSTLTEPAARMSVEPPANAPAGSAPAFGHEDLPDWMKSGQTMESGLPGPFVGSDNRASNESAPPFASQEMNEMLQGVSPEEGGQKRSGADSEPESLEPAQLPSWLQAMRPVESAVTPAVGVDEQRVERSGPLAGLRGVLQGEELVANYRKPPVYTNKLQVSEKQRLNSALLERILYDETQAQAVPGAPTRASQMIARVLVAVLLILLVLAPALTGFKIGVPAALAGQNAGASAMFKSINDIQPGSYVLVAADYEAGWSGEMQIAAQAVLRHLQQRQPRVILTSTLPTGPILGEALLKDAKITPLANLGYLAGGSNTLKRFSLAAGADLPAPLAEVVPFPYIRGWNDPAMQGLRDLGSFQRILVLTDSVENARAWIEQVQPALGPQTQLVMVSSAQAAPLVRTYLESGQIKGLVSGLLGGTTYEQFLRQPGLGENAWTAYQLTLAALIVLILAGAVAAGISNLLRRGKSKRKA